VCGKRNNQLLPPTMVDFWTQKGIQNATNVVFLSSCVCACACNALVVTLSDLQFRKTLSICNRSYLNFAQTVATIFSIKLGLSDF